MITVSCTSKIPPFLDLKMLFGITIHIISQKVSNNSAFMQKPLE